ncbi:helix-turn-helix domain-containing protein [Luteimicrobium sp. DT211]|uniref:helix-turn-helix domain-containing protein n=1 Tax=Luteimicrobium sp. DT211 TaxID=3393412 RepID=UPI003CF944AD
MTTATWRALGLGPAPEPEPDPDADARALASALRLRILRLCLDEPHTNKEIAHALGRNPGSVLHHVRTLVARGFLAALPERDGPRGSREVPYLATGRSWLTPMTPSQAPVLVEAFVEEVAEAPPETTELVRLGLRLDEAGRNELTERVVALFQEFADREPDPAGEPYAVFYAFYEDAQRRRARDVSEPGEPRGSRASDTPPTA